MKKMITILIMCFCCSVFGAKAQSDTLAVETVKDSLKTVAEPLTVKLDSLTMDCLRSTHYMVERVHPRYKIYKTDNIYILLKLDTATGRVWMVQYGMGEDTLRMEVAIDETSLLWDFENITNGRYELYPTNNMYNFILIDTQVGATYQVQWHTDADRCFRIRIY